MKDLNKIYNENSIDGMNQMERNSVDLTVTSPPYDNLRSYKDGVGDGWNFDTFKSIANGLYDVTKDGGVVVWVVGDAVVKGGETGSSFKQALYFIELGFQLIDTFIYEKNGSSFPSRRDGNRYSQIFEYMFVFSKNKKPNTYKIENKQILKDSNIVIINDLFSDKKLIQDLVDTWGSEKEDKNFIDLNNGFNQKDIKDFKDVEFIYKEYIPTSRFDMKDLKNEINIYKKLINKGSVISFKINEQDLMKDSYNGIPFKIALEYINNGFLLHDTMLIKEGDGYSFLFIFSYKSKPLNSTLIVDKPNRWAGHTTFGKGKARNKDGTLVDRAIKPVPDFSPRNNIWEYKKTNSKNIWKFLNGKNYSTKDNEAFEHPAIFPERLSEDCILIWSKEGDTVLDPFMGSGTTAKMSILNNRNYIGFELSSEYIEIAEKRLKKYIK